MATLNFSAFDATPERVAAFETAGPSDTIFAGWIPPDERDDAGNKAHDAIMTVMPSFQLVGKSANDNATKVCLWDCWQKALGKPFIGIQQLTGSCVGAGGGNALFSLAAADVVKRGDRERATIPFWLYPYGISRQIGGLGGRGEGSFGSTFAQAVREYGHVPGTDEGLPGFEETDGITWGKATELDWSDGRKAPQSLRDKAKPHLVKSTAKCRNADDVREAIKNYYPVTIASNWGGEMRPRVQSGVLLNRRVTNWMHQMSIHAWWDHPELGEIFYILNQWGRETHGRCPSGAPGGGFWVRKADVDSICSQGETFAFSQFDGFPSVDKPLDFSAF